MSNRGEAVGIERKEPDVEVVANRRTVVTALPLKAAARQRLAELLEARVFDIRERAMNRTSC